MALGLSCGLLKELLHCFIHLLFSGEHVKGNIFGRGGGVVLAGQLHEANWVSSILDVSVTASIRGKSGDITPSWIRASFESRIHSRSLQKNLQRLQVDQFLVLFVVL